MLLNKLDIQILKGRHKKHNQKWHDQGKGLNGQMALKDIDKEEVIRRANYKCEICHKGKKIVTKESFYTYIFDKNSRDRFGYALFKRYKCYKKVEYSSICLVVHHLRYSPLNYNDLQALCMSCHNKINAKRRREKKKGVKEIMVMDTISLLGQEIDDEIANGINQGDFLKGIGAGIGFALGFVNGSGLEYPNSADDDDKEEFYLGVGVGVALSLAGGLLERFEEFQKEYNERDERMEKEFRERGPKDLEDFGPDAIKCKRIGFKEDKN